MLMFAVGLGRVRSAYISCGLGWVIENGPTTMSDIYHCVRLNAVLLSMA